MIEQEHIQWKRLRATLKELDFALLDDEERLRRALSLAIEEEGYPVAELGDSHRFEPQGVSLCFVAPAYRVLVHTWPELGALTLDVSSSHGAEQLIGACEQTLKAHGREKQ